MPVRGRCWGLIAVLAAGCHGPALVAPPPAFPTAPHVAAELPAVTPSRIEPDLASLPSLNPETAAPPAADPAAYRGLTETACQCLAAAHSAAGNLLDREGDWPTVAAGGKRHQCPNDAWLREARRYAALEARNRAAAEALERYFQLADAEGRADLLADGLRAFDQLRAQAPKFRAAGLPVPADDELLRQRAKLLADAEQAEAAIRILNVDLKARLGLPLKEGTRLRPMGSFGVPSDPIDSEAAVRVALERRPDLRLLRTLYANLTAENLPAARDQLRSVNALLGAVGAAVPRPRGLAAIAAWWCGIDPAKLADAAELPVRRRQLFELICEREQQAAAEVRTAAGQMAVAARRVALAKARVQSWQAKAEKTEKPADRLPAELEWYKARGELVADVMAWHQWRVKFRAAQGLLAEECLSGP